MDATGERLTLHIRGHAGYAARGQDIVCAGVSTLAQTLALTLEDTPGADARTHASAGELTLTCADTPRTRELFRMCRIGFRALAERYGAWVFWEEGGKPLPEVQRRYYVQKPNRKNTAEAAEDNRGSFVDRQKRKRTNCINTPCTGSRTGDADLCPP
jgi:uncharacterized protein YsxB (DUF464 family)